MFDLPVVDKTERKEATKFRDFLLGNGFGMCQFSVYARFCGGKGAFKSLTNRISSNLPQKGSVWILQITDKQYEKIVSFFLSERQPKMKNPDQYRLF